MKFTEKDGKVLDRRGNEMRDISTCGDGTEWEGTSERNTTCTMRWDSAAGHFSITNASGTPRFLVPK